MPIFHGSEENLDTMLIGVKLGGAKTKTGQEDLGGRDSFNSSRSSSRERLRLFLLLSLKTLPGGGISFLTRASPGGILLLRDLDAVNERSSVLRLRLLPLNFRGRRPMTLRRSRSLPDRLL